MTLPIGAIQVGDLVSIDEEHYKFYLVLEVKEDIPCTKLKLLTAQNKETKVSINSSEFVDIMPSLSMKGLEWGNKKAQNKLQELN